MVYFRFGRIRLPDTCESAFTLENDAKVIVRKYHSPTFDDGPVQIALFNSPAS